MRDLKMSIASSRLFKRVYRDHRDKSEDDDWDANKTLLLHGGQIDEPAPPQILLVQGPPNVGKSLLIRSLINHFSSIQHMNDDIRATITILTGDKRRRIQFVECPDDINAMVDAAKYADAVLLLVDASFGFEAETFEFLNLLRAHGLPKVTGVLTHLDEFKDEKELKETIEHLQDHFRTEIYQGLQHHLYKMSEIQELAEAISDSKFFPTSWRAAQPYVMVDRFEDVTPLERVQKDTNCDRDISLYGYLRGCNIKSGAKVHIAGVGDYCLSSVTSLADPFPLSSKMEEENDHVDQTYMEAESFKTGAYLRLKVCDVPFGLVENFNPCQPILVGGISLEEEDVGYMQARIRRHNWHRKLLMSRDPITVSAGWRRYQTKPIYAMESDSTRHKFLKFTPEHEHCRVMFWGPLAPPLTRIVVVQSNKKEAFRIAAKAVILHPKLDMKIMKESKRKGIPYKILKRTALIKRKGTRGQVGDEASERDGDARCKVKGRIRMSGIVFMRVLRQVEAPRFFSTLSSVPDNMEKDDPAQRQRRIVEIVDVEPCSYSCSNPLTVIYSLKYMNKKNKGREIENKKYTVMCKEEQGAYERGAKMSKRRKDFTELAMILDL